MTSIGAEKNLNCNNKQKARTFRMYFCTISINNASRLVVAVQEAYLRLADKKRYIWFI
jgi:hypothetical protein